jgi:glycosyltransferase involved in cell wall biosynthesis
MRVALDASAAAKERRTGVGHYVARLADALLAEDPSLVLDLGVRLSRWRRRRHVHVPPGADGRARTKWFPSFWPGLRLSGADVAHGPDARLVGGSSPQVVTFHDLFNLKSSQWADEAFREKKARNYAEAAAGAARVICVSEATARDVESLLKVPRERLVVTPLGVDPSYRPLDPAASAPVLSRLQVRPPYLLFVGLAQPRKNLEVVAAIFGRLSARIDDLTLVLAGDDGYPEGRLFAILKETGAVERVRRLGYVSPDDLPALYSAAAALVFPSRDEGFGLPVLEAMACGCPFVSSDRGSLPEVAGEGALCFPPDALDDHEDAVGRLLDDPEFRATQVERGLARAKEFPWSRTARATLAAYRAAAGVRG